MRALSIVALLACVACDGPSASHAPLAMGSMEMFEAEVEPALEAHCASGGCHGRSDRPLSLYAPGQHRMDPARLYADEPLSEEEVHQNAQRLAAFAWGVDGPDSLALRKPLSLEAGGCWHGGGDVFPDRSHPAYRAIERWLSTRSVVRDGGVR